LSGSSYCTTCEENGFPETKIYWDDSVRSKKTGKKIPLDKGGQYHKHRDTLTEERPEIEQDENQTPPVRSAFTPNPPEVQKQFDEMLKPIPKEKEQDQRSKDIAAAHLENMQASEKHTTAINNLAGEVATLTTAIGDFKDFMGKVLHQVLVHPADRAMAMSEPYSEDKRDPDADFQSKAYYHKQNNEDPRS
jgi:hypothetical protein